MWNSTAVSGCACHTLECGPFILDSLVLYYLYQYWDLMKRLLGISMDDLNADIPENTTLLQDRVRQLFQLLLVYFDDHVRDGDCSKSIVIQTLLIIDYLQFILRRRDTRPSIVKMK
jgi:hypothetical protein